MEATVLIIAALKAGASFIGEKVAGEAVKDAYNTLKEKLAERIGSPSEITTLFPRPTEITPEWEVSAARVLDNAGLSSDPSLAAAARAVLTQVNQSQTTSGKFSIQATTIGNVIQGDFASIRIEPKPKGE